MYRNTSLWVLSTGITWGGAWRVAVALTTPVAGDRFLHFFFYLQVLLECEAFPKQLFEKNVVRIHSARRV